MKLPNPLAAGAVLTVSHFLASLSIIPVTLRVGEALADGAANAFLYGLLTVATKWLYFPILAMALYPRHWFPGQLIAIPIAVNSLLWGSIFVLALVAGRHFQMRRRR